MRGTNILGLILKSSFEHSAGRIRWQRNMWAVIGSRWDRKRLVSLKGEIELDGKVLIRRICVHCPCPPGNDFAPDSKGRWWSVPATECRKCQYHRPSGRNRFRFPRCTYNKSDDARNVARDTLVQVSGIVGEAVRQTKEIMGER